MKTRSCWWSGNAYIDGKINRGDVTNKLKKRDLEAMLTKRYDWIIIDSNGANVKQSAALTDSNDASFIVIISEESRFDSNNEESFRST